LGLQFQWAWGSTLGEYFPSNEETIFETLKPLGQYLSQAPFYVNVQPGRASARLGGASFSPVPLRRGIPGPWQAGSTVAVAIAIAIAFFCRELSTPCSSSCAFFVLRSSLGLSGPAILVVFNATRLMRSKIVEQAAATCKALAPKIARRGLAIQQSRSWWS